MLLEVPVVISDSITPCRYLECGHGIKEAGSETSEATPAESQVTLVFIKLLEVIPEVFQGLRILIHHVQVHQDVLHHSPLEVLR